MTTDTRELRTSPEIGGMGHSVKRKEDPRFIRGAGEYIDDFNLPGQLWLDIVRSPYAHATIKGIDATEALKIPGVLAVITGADLEKAGLHWMPTLAGDKQMVLPTDDGHVPVPGGRRGRRDDQVHRGRRRRRGHAWTTSRCRSSSTRTSRWSRTPSSSARTAARTRPTTTSGTGSRATGPATDAAIASADVHVERGHLHPADPRRVHRDVRLHRGLGRRPWPDDAAHDQPGAARHPDGARARQRPAGAEHPGQDPRHRWRLRRQGAGLPGLRPRGRRLADRRQAGQVDRGPLGEPPGRLVRPRLPHPRRGRRRQGRPHHAHSRSRRSPTTATPMPRPIPPSSRPASSTSSPAVTTSPNAFVEVDGVYTNKPPGGVAYRCSFRVTEAVHAVERMVDILAHEIGKDPAQLRMENFIQPEQFPYKTPTGW